MLVQVGVRSQNFSGCWTCSSDHKHRLLPAQRQHVITICFMKQVVWHFIAVKQHRWRYVKPECEEDIYTLPFLCPGYWTKWWSSKPLCETPCNHKCIGRFQQVETRLLTVGQTAGQFLPVFIPFFVPTPLGYKQCQDLFFGTEELVCPGQTS